MAAVALLKENYETLLRDEKHRRRGVEKRVRVLEECLREARRKSAALQSILACESFSSPSSSSFRRVCRWNSLDDLSNLSPSRRRSLVGEELRALRASVRVLEQQLMKKNNLIEEMRQQGRELRTRESALAENLQHFQLQVMNGVETERILRGELEMAADSLDRLVLYSQSEETTVLRHRLSQIQNSAAESEERIQAQEKLLQEMKIQIADVLGERDALREEVERLKLKCAERKREADLLKAAFEQMKETPGMPGKSPEREEQTVSSNPSLCQDRHCHCGVALSSLAWQVEDERAIARSLHTDLDALRKMLIDREIEKNDLNSELENARRHCSRLSMELEILEGRIACEQGKSETDIAFSSDLLLQNEQLRLQLNDAVSNSSLLTRKLESQGRELSLVKKEIARLRIAGSTSR